MSGRDCSFASQTPIDKALSTAGTSSKETSMSPSDNQSQAATPPTPAPSFSHAPLPERPRISINIHQATGSLDEPINFNHMELFIHLMLDKEIFKLGITTEDHHVSLIPTGLKTSLETPYLLYQILAFSSRHLALLNPNRSAFYLHQAITLQTRAVSLFNAAWTGSEVNHSNCVPVLLFSATLGYHLLADTLAKREPVGLDAFLTQFVQFLETQIGIYTIAKSVWPLLMESELKEIMSWSSGFTSRSPRGSHCQPVRELVDNAAGLDDEDKAACQKAIDYLQLGFDALTAEAGQHEGNRHQMIFTWTMLTPINYIRLLAAKRPEALIVLAYYAALLHHGRNFWQVLDSGVYILGLITDYLPSSLHHWLKYPQELIVESLE
ncbi:Fc.00g084400.m01.CDS01 [Cosmosporella sp. VM-42]